MQMGSGKTFRHSAGRGRITNKQISQEPIEDGAKCYVSPVLFGVASLQ
jgi:hypothetical protein